VVGVKDLAETNLSSVPPLLEAAHPELVCGLGVCDEKLLVVLKAARVVPDEVWEALAREHEGADPGRD
jgi:purine-binding chemotaxis protein CheW